jgi:phosphotransacetylase
VPRHHHIFSSIIRQAKLPGTVDVAVIFPLGEVALRGACEAADAGPVHPLLVAPEAEIKALAKSCNLVIADYPIIDAETAEEAAQVGVWHCADPA